jgi:proteasome lid subunit RPN8/RPN11
MKLVNKIDKLFEDIALTDTFLEQQLELLAKSTQEIESAFYLKDGMVLQNKRFDVGRGDYKSVNYDLNAVLAQAQELGADEIISVHNHPNGTHHPSQKDIEAFRHMKQLFGQNNIKLKAYVVAGGQGEGNVDYTEYDETTSPDLHTKEYIAKAKDLVSQAVQQGFKIQADDKAIEQQFSTVKNITDFENKINALLHPYNLKFVPVGS